MDRSEIVAEIQRRAKEDGLTIHDMYETPDIVAVLSDPKYPQGAVAVSLSGLEIAQRTPELVASRYDNAIKTLRAGNASH